jgi:ribonuclease D
LTTTLLDSPGAVSRFCESIAGARALAVDTEFMRERTFRAVLALVQLAAPDGRIALVDCLAVGGDAWVPLTRVLRDPSIVKVFHAAQGDVEVLEQRIGAVPSPLWDTQLVTGLIGYKGQIGYGDLVEDFTGVRLTKHKTLTDWTKRPLSSEQTEYAADDVRYLLPIYELERERLARLGRLDWAEEECRNLEADLTAAINERANDEEVYRSVKGWHRLDRRALAILRELAAWREKEAARRDIPRPWVMRDDLLVQLARVAPKNAAQLRENRIEGRDVERAGPTILAAVQRGKRVAEQDCPEPATLQRPLDDSESALISLLSAVLQTVSKRHSVAPGLIATRDDLESLVRRHSEGGSNGHHLLTGWRGELVGSDLVALLEGRRQVGWNPVDRLIEIRD